MGDLHKYFDQKEFYTSSTNPDLAKNAYLNRSEFHKHKQLYLVKTILVPVREHYGEVQLTSGVRPPMLNEAVGGSDTSDHLYIGESACCDYKIIARDSTRKVDWILSAKLTAESFEYIMTYLPYSFGQLILYKRPDGTAKHVHVSLPSYKNHREIFINQNNKLIQIAA